ncbi:hypothetical protein [Humidesulfovibrio sp.]
MAEQQVSTSSHHVQTPAVMAENIAAEALHPIMAFKCILEDLSKGVNGGDDSVRMHLVADVLDALWDQAYVAVCEGVERALTDKTAIAD